MNKSTTTKSNLSKVSNSKKNNLTNVRTGKITNADIKDRTKNIVESGKYIYIVIATTLISFAININAIMWIIKLEKINCACSEHWMRKYIEYYLYAIIPIQVLNIIIWIGLYSTNNIKEFNFYNTKNTLLRIYLSFTQIMAFFGFINIFIVIIFINRLKEINCHCSEDIKREVYYIYNIVQLSIVCIYIFFAIIGIFLFLNNN